MNGKGAKYARGREINMDQKFCTAFVAPNGTVARLPPVCSQVRDELSMNNLIPPVISSGYSACR
jgi:hypothetical protein